MKSRNRPSKLGKSGQRVEKAVRGSKVSRTFRQRGCEISVSFFRQSSSSRCRDLIRCAGSDGT